MIIITYFTFGGASFSCVKIIRRVNIGITTTVPPASTAAVCLGTNECADVKRFTPFKPFAARRFFF